MPNPGFTVGDETGSIHALSGRDGITLSGSVMIGVLPPPIDNERAIDILSGACQVSACLSLKTTLGILFAARLLQISPMAFAGFDLKGDNPWRLVRHGRDSSTQRPHPWGWWEICDHAAEDYGGTSCDTDNQPCRKNCLKTASP
jgi:hypothetical protein